MYLLCTWVVVVVVIAVVVVVGWLVGVFFCAKWHKHLYSTETSLPNLLIHFLSCFTLKQSISNICSIQNEEAECLLLSVKSQEGDKRKTVTIQPRRGGIMAWISPTC